MDGIRETRSRHHRREISLAMDVVVTVPKGQWQDWLAEGDLPGDPESDMLSHFWVPNIPTMTEYGARVYVVSHGRLRGYARLDSVESSCYLRPDRACLVRRGGAAAVTIPGPIKGFQGVRYRWWDRADEVLFPDWQTAGVEG